ncbi:MAG TPA: DUF805 domain-containing protein [Pseudomonadales bacterium]|nr:DUF805 domain-containing protein [Pseudomonadales bacterium]
MENLDYFTDAFKKFAEVNGRTTRKPYWMFVLIYMIIYIVLLMLDKVIGSAILSGIFSVATLIPSITIATRRLHDTGRTGWWQLLIFLPLLGVIGLIYLLCQDSEDDNEYGPKPEPAA